MGSRQAEACRTAALRALIARAHLNIERRQRFEEPFPLPPANLADHCRVPQQTLQREADVKSGREAQLRALVWKSNGVAQQRLAMRENMRVVIIDVLCDPIDPRICERRRRWRVMSSELGCNSPR